MINDIVAFIRDRLAEDVAAVQYHLCIHCGNPTVPLRSPLGVTGYSHGGGWEGRRCPRRLTGAEPVQDPARVLRGVEAKQRLLDRIEARHTSVTGALMATQTLGDLRVVASEWNTHQDYLQEWK